MKFVLASWGSRGDIEPCVAVGRELLRRGHDVLVAVPPDVVGFAESAGLAAVAYGPDARAILDAHRTFWTRFFRKPWRIQDLIRLRREVEEPVIQRWGEISTTLTSLADGADLLVTGVNFEDVAANVAEHYDIPLATLHTFPLRANGQFVPILPAPLGRCAMTVFGWVAWRMAKKLEDAQRRELGLPKTTGPLPRRITERGSLEIQAYDEVCFPGLAAEWAKRDGRKPPQRPFVGALTMELLTDADEEVASWIAAGTPPIFFGFGSIPVESPAETLAMIGAACAQLGERALIGAAGTDFSNVALPDHVKVVGAVNYATIFPACRALVHHGGSSTTPIAMRAGVPQLILFWDLDQTLWGARVKRLKVGTARRLSSTTQESLVADLRTILAPQYVTRAREMATRMTKPAASVAAVADLVEDFARLRPR
jgi:UDP:flavonoid glycosyltransferase YjiC (YdhE family)